MLEILEVWGRKGNLSEGNPRTPYDVPCIMGVAKIPRVFKVVKDIKRVDDGTVRLVGNGRLKVEIPVQLGFLETATLEGLVE